MLIRLFKIIFISALTFITLNCGGESGRRSSDVLTSQDDGAGVASYIKIESAPDGLGTEVTNLIIVNGEFTRLYAVSRDRFGDFVDNEIVTWSTDTVDGHFSTTLASTTVFSHSGVSESITIAATHNTLPSDTTGSVNVFYEASAIPGLSLWLKADYYKGKLSDDAVLNTWNDLSGNNRDFTAIATGREPSFETNIINGQPTVRFRFSNQDVLQSSATLGDVISNSAFTYYIVFIPRSISTNDTNPSLNNALMIDTNGNFGITMRFSTPLVQAFNFDGAYSQITKPIGLANSYLFSSFHEGGDLYAQLNVDATASVSSGNTSDLTGLINIGGGFSPTAFFEGDIAEVIVYNTSLLASQRIRIQNYLCTKYNLSCP